MVKYIDPGFGAFNFWDFQSHIRSVVRAMDNVIDLTTYPLPDQREYHQRNRRMGLGVTGLANAGEALGYAYGTPAFLTFTREVMESLRDTAYWASVQLAKERGAFPDFTEELLDSGFAKRLPKDLRDAIRRWGLRNSHLLSIAPTGTISICADNVSGGIEPPFSHEYDRTIRLSPTQTTTELVQDYAVREWGIRGRTANEISVQEHLDVLTTVQAYVDSACSKTCNVGSDVSFKDFKRIYIAAWEEGAKGITTFRAAGKRYGILNERKPEDKAEACYIDPTTGAKECS